MAEHHSTESCISFLTIRLLMDTKHDILTASVILPARKQGAHLFQTFYSQRMKSKLALSVKSLQLCPPLCNPMGHSLPGSSAQGILQARMLEWVAMPFSRESSRPRDRTCVSYDSCIGRHILYH